MLRFLVPMFFYLSILSRSTAQECEASAITNVTNCKHIKWVHVKGKYNCPFNLTCEKNCPGNVTWFFRNSTEPPLKIPPNYSSAEGLLAVRGPRHEILQITPSYDYQRVQLDGNYSCGCTNDEDNKEGRHVYVLVFHNINSDRPRVYVAEIGHSFALASRLVFGTNRYALSGFVSWKKIRLDPYCDQTEHQLGSDPQKVNYTDLFFDEVKESDGPSTYSQTVDVENDNDIVCSRSKKVANHSLVFYGSYKDNQGESDVLFYPYKVPTIEVTHPGHLRGGNEILLLRHNGELLPRGRKSVIFKLSPSQRDWYSLTTNLSINTSDIFYKITNYSMESIFLMVDLKGGEKFPASVSVTYSAALSITKDTITSLNSAYKKLNRNVNVLTLRTVVFRIFEINSLEFTVTYELLCEVQFIRVNASIAKAVPKEYDYRIEFLSQVPSGLVKLEPFNLSSSILLDMKGRLGETKLVLVARLMFDLTGETVLGAQHEERIYNPCRAADSSTGTTTISTPIVITIAACTSAVIIVITSFAIVVTVILARRRGGCGQHNSRSSFSSTSQRHSHVIVMRPSASNCDIHTCTGSCASNLTDISSLPGSVVPESDIMLWEELKSSQEDENGPVEGGGPIHPVMLHSPRPPVVEDCQVTPGCLNNRRLQHRHRQRQRHAPKTRPPCGHIDCITSRRRDRSTQSMPYEMPPQVRMGRARNSRRQRSFSASQIDENFSRQRLRRPSQIAHPVVCRISLTEERDEEQNNEERGESQNEEETSHYEQMNPAPSLTTTGANGDAGNNTSSGSAGLQVPTRLTHSRHNSDDRPPSSLTTNSVRSNACLLNHSQDEQSEPS